MKPAIIQPLVLAAPLKMLSLALLALAAPACTHGEGREAVLMSGTMEPRISIVTLGVADLPRAIAFYRDGLGLALENDGEGIAMFAMQGTKLALYPREKLAEDATVPSTPPSGFSGVVLSHNMRSREEVDALLKRAEAVGATIVKPAQDVFWGGYSGYFSDPDGHLWEVAWNPYWEFDQ